jgi:DNA-binding protein YbaB
MITLEEQRDELKSKLAEIEKQIEESKVKTKYEIGQEFIVIGVNGDTNRVTFKDSLYQNEYIAMGNDAATIEEAERKIRRRKAVVKYNEIVERENSICGRPIAHFYYLNRKNNFIACDEELGTDLRAIHPYARGCIQEQLTPELLSDLFCN